MSTNQIQQIILIISRYNLSASVIPPLRIILATLSLISPLRLYTSMIKQIKQQNFASLYEALVYHLENEQGEVSLNDTLSMIYQQKKLQQQYQQRILKKGSNQKDISKSYNPWNFRVCIMGQQIVSWEVVMKYKLKSIIIDTLGSHKRLCQISFATGGINRPSNPQTLIKLFLSTYSLSTQTRKKFSFLNFHSTSIQFTVDCVCCKGKKDQLAGQCYLCSKCLAVHCNRIVQSCVDCGEILHSIKLNDRPC